jgi:hypothetical protein
MISKATPTSALPGIWSHQSAWPAKRLRGIESGGVFAVAPAEAQRHRSTEAVISTRRGTGLFFRRTGLELTGEDGTYGAFRLGQK